MERRISIIRPDSYTARGDFNEAEQTGRWAGEAAALMRLRFGSVTAVSGPAPRKLTALKAFTNRCDIPRWRRRGALISSNRSSPITCLAAENVEIAEKDVLT